jgi:hypothetical protein
MSPWATKTFNSVALLKVNISIVSKHLIVSESSTVVQFRYIRLAIPVSPFTGLKVNAIPPLAALFMNVAWMWSTSWVFKLYPTLVHLLVCKVAGTVNCRHLRFLMNMLLIYQLTRFDLCLLELLIHLIQSHFCEN